MKYIYAYIYTTLKPVTVRLCFHLLFCQTVSINFGPGEIFHASCLHWFLHGKTKKVSEWKWSKQNEKIFLCARISLKHPSTVLEAKTCCLSVRILRAKHTFWGSYHLSDLSPNREGFSLWNIHLWMLIRVLTQIGRLIPWAFHFHQELSLRTARPG